MKLRDYFGMGYEEVTFVTVKGEGINLHIQLWGAEGPLSTLTVNLGESAGNNSILMPYRAFVDTNNCPYGEEFIQAYGLGEPCTRFGEPVIGGYGYCAYPLYQFNKEKLAELDPNGCLAYEKSWQANEAAARKRVCGL